MIRGRFVEYRQNRNFGCLSTDDVKTQGQSIRLSVMGYLLSLQEIDFIPEFVEQPNKFINIIDDTVYPLDKNPSTLVQKTGNLLYHIPKLMQIEKSHRCIFRIAYYREILRTGWKINNDDIEKKIRIAEEMQVELIDVNSGYIKHFDVKPINKSLRQALDADDYTEWLFDVTPLKLGVSVLRLHVTAIENRSGRDVSKEIVHEEEIVITTNEIELKDTKLEAYKGVFIIKKSFAIKEEEKEVQYELKIIVEEVLKNVLSVILFPFILVFSFFTRRKKLGGDYDDDDD